jgi:hypothetical protein
LIAIGDIKGREYVYWCLTSAIAKFLLPRIKDFKEHYCLAEPSDQIHRDLDKMIQAFELVIADGIDYRDPITRDGKSLPKDGKRFVTTILNYGADSSFKMV